MLGGAFEYSQWRFDNWVLKFGGPCGQRASQTHCCLWHTTARSTEHQQVRHAVNKTDKSLSLIITVNHSFNATSFMIFRSLSSLGDVIAAMASGHKHVPYRNSKLTFLLQDALKESSKVLMFVNINPSPVFTGESTCSLQFATRCRYSNAYIHTCRYVSHHIMI